MISAPLVLLILISICIPSIDDKPFGPGRSRRKEMGALWRSLARFFIPIDILLYSSDEVEKWRDSKNHVIAQAMQEGRVVYEQN